MRNEWTCKVEQQDGGTRLVMSGSITETSDLRSVLPQLRGPVSIDLHGVQRINSIGVREWIDFMGRVQAAAKDVALDRCSVAMVHQFNMITGMRGSAKVRSVMLPYLCTGCGKEQTVLLPLDGGAPAIKNELPCPSCHAAMEFDDLPETYLAFLKRKG